MAGRDWQQAVLDEQLEQDRQLALALSLQPADHDEDDPTSAASRCSPPPAASSAAAASASYSHLPAAMSVVDPRWELTDPNPNIHELFLTYDRIFFYNTLQHIEVKWSPRMTLCAGVCSYDRAGFCSVRLSVPLLRLRPRADLVNTLLHEMIHAYLFVTRADQDRDGHGPSFLEQMERINRLSGSSVTVYHTFHDEVDVYRTHWWRCDGKCRAWPPYFGIVKRAMNRPPSERDSWWLKHQRSCGGTYTKIREPSKDEAAAAKQRAANDKPALEDSQRATDQPTITSAFKKVVKADSGHVLGRGTPADTTHPVLISRRQNDSWSRRNDDTSTATPPLPTREPPSQRSPEAALEPLHDHDHPTSALQDAGDNELDATDELACPVCSQLVTLQDMSTHLDACLQTQPPDGPMASTDDSPPTEKTSSGVSAGPEAATDADLAAAVAASLQDVAPCPVCNQELPVSAMDAHVDACLQTSAADGDDLGGMQRSGPMVATAAVLVIDDDDESEQWEEMHQHDGSSAANFGNGQPPARAVHGGDDPSEILGSYKPKKRKV